MTSIQATGTTTITAAQQERFANIKKFRTAPDTRIVTTVNQSTTATAATPIAKENSLKTKKVTKEKTQGLSLGAKIFAVATTALVGLVVLNNPAINPSLITQPCPYTTKTPNALPLNSMATLYADCYPEQSLLLGRLTGAQIDALLNRADYPEEWPGGFIDRAFAKLHTAAQNVTGAVPRLISVIGNALRLGVSDEGEYPIELPPLGSDSTPYKGWAPLRFFLNGQSASSKGGIDIHPTTQAQLQTLPQPVAEQFVKELTAACDPNQSTYNEKLCYNHQWSTASMDHAGNDIGKSVYRRGGEPFFTARTQIHFSAGENQEGQPTISMSSSVRDSEQYQACTSGMNTDAKDSLECINRNSYHEHDTFNVNCEISTQNQTVSCVIRNIHHAIGNNLVYKVLEQLVSSTCSIVTETLTLAGNVITNVTYAANPQNSKPYILGQFTQRVVFEQLRNMTVQAGDFFKQLVGAKYPQITISPKLPSNLPKTCAELAQTQN